MGEKGGKKYSFQFCNDLLMALKQWGGGLAGRGELWLQLNASWHLSMLQTAQQSIPDMTSHPAANIGKTRKVNDRKKLIQDLDSQDLQQLKCLFCLLLPWLVLLYSKFVLNSSPPSSCEHHCTGSLSQTASILPNYTGAEQGKGSDFFSITKLSQCLNHRLSLDLFDHSLNPNYYPITSPGPRLTASFKAIARLVRERCWCWEHSCFLPGTSECAGFLCTGLYFGYGFCFQSSTTPVCGTD